MSNARSLKNRLCESSSGVEHHLAKVRVAGSNPVFRSRIARMVELVDTLDLKSNGHYGRTGSSPVFSTEKADTFVSAFLLGQTQVKHLMLRFY